MPVDNDNHAWPALEAWSATMRDIMHSYARLLSPARLDQPILPGWHIGNTFFVSDENSRDPSMEHRILAENSYGRQLGRISEALLVLVKQQPAAESADFGDRDRSFRRS